MAVGRKLAPCRCPQLLLKRFASAVAAASRQVRREDFKPMIGLEVHVQLRTRTKLFSRAPSGLESGPNTLVSIFDMAVPGTMPALNRQAVMLGLRMGLLLNCEISKRFRFDRKHYFYADMPAGYQITQSDFPIAHNGRMPISVYGEDVAGYSKDIEILQLQLEQDSGKTIHQGNVSLIDLNRAGVPLVEVVTTPCFSTALEAACFIQQLRLQLMHYGICEGELHKGHMRVDANVSISDSDKPGVRTEIKNMNSLRHLRTAINFEIDRHFRIIANGGTVVNETRGCDQQGRTVSMRDKETEADYRIMPEPNLPWVTVKDDWLSEQAKVLSSSSPSYRQYMATGFDPMTSIHYAEECELGSFVDNCAPHFGGDVTAEMFVAWLKELKLIMQRSNVPFPPQSKFFAEQFVTVVRLFGQKRITKLRALRTLRDLAGDSSEKETVEEIIERDRSWRYTEEEVRHVVEAVGRENEDLVKKAASGHAKSVTKWRNLVVDRSQLCADVSDVEKQIADLLKRIKG